ncbi:phospholipid phosphatase [Actinotalea ferrariae CF5-4]|uniref:Phospholipid phosphatase n=1 Tax=Actinotalea ferrariae CF5-4 TaxID=948458 RepID=A0A021VQX6_9CELL|nr:phosphatase PAP2 family protein [Actinotalea ferrariae]EYR63604.1 phospholipid phosphatase [Actinotalea ferrariae CF5-4]
MAHPAGSQGSYPRSPQEGRTRPLTAATRRDLLRRGALPVLLLWLGVVGVGLLIVGPLDSLPAEVALNEALEEQRTPVMNTLTAVWSHIGATEFIIGACVLVVAFLWWRTRQWRRAFVPAIAISVQAAVFLTSAVVVGRERPEVEPLDEAPPTSGFPSGHVGASTAFYLTLTLLASRIRSAALRWTAMTVCLLVPFLVAFARLYRGMHHLSDVIVGAINGVVCALLAWRYLHAQEAKDEAPEVGGDETPAGGPGEVASGQGPVAPGPVPRAAPGPADRA